MLDNYAQSEELEEENYFNTKKCYVIILSIYKDMYWAWFLIIPSIYDCFYGVRCEIIPSVFNYTKLYRCTINNTEQK